MARDANVVAASVSDLLGGELNIEQLTHCATRLRVITKDDMKVDTKALGETEGVHGYFFKNGQHQVILGTGFVSKVFAVLAGDSMEKPLLLLKQKKIQVLHSNL